MQRKPVRIGVVAPASAIDRSISARTIGLARVLFGDNAPDIVFHPQCFLSSGHFAGDDGARTEAFLDIANDPNFDALWFARGGYGSGRLTERLLPGLVSAAADKIYLGYSDAGSLLGALYARKIGRPVHGPMPSDINRAGGEAAVGRALAFLRNGDPAGVEPTSAGGTTPVAAFNITILSHLIGTPLLPDLSGHILLLEEVSEYMYRIDRDLLHITSHPPMRGLAGIKLGRCSDIPPNQPDFGANEEDVARFWCDRAGIAYLGRADIGHDIDNRIVPFGVWTSRPDGPLIA